MKKEKCYVLDMFPYPSGDGLHVGHPKGYVATDIYSRYKKMNNFDVVHPMGWDAFGLPAEQHAIKNKTNPKIQTEKNIANFKSQLEKINLDYDWDREISTTDPKFYKWTQWIFKQLYKKGLAFESYEPINWCPSCKTGLANEDLEGNACERCGTVVEKKPLRQWNLKITNYADRLISDLDTLNNWPEWVKTAQKNWIGKSEGSEIDFEIKSIDNNFNSKFKIFTTRADTLFGCTYTVLAPEHILVKELLEKNIILNKEEVEKYISEVKLKTDIERSSEGKEKTGVKLEGVMAISPANKKEIPVYIADYVLASYGTGAIMAVPAHDERDFEFAEKYNVEISNVEVINTDEERKRITDLVGGKVVTKYKLRDWVFARQRYWGEPFPVVYATKINEETGQAERDSAVAPIMVADSELPVLLPAVESYEPTGTGESPLAIIDDFVNVYGYVNEDGEFESIKNYFRFEDKFIEEVMSGKKNNTIRLENKNIKIGEIVNIKNSKDEIICKIKINNILEKKLEDLDIGNPNGTSYTSKEEQLDSYRRYYGENVNLETNFYIFEFELSDKEIKLFKRETNTMPQWAGSSWYYLRFLDNQNENFLIDPKIEAEWQHDSKTVDVYVGGDHATRHLIYARFWHKFLYDIGVVTTLEPFGRLEFLGFILAEDGSKMSKSKGNTINPDSVVAEYGSDAFRVYEMFMAPFEATAMWSTSSIKGVKRFIERVEKLKSKIGNACSNENIIHQTIKKVGEDIENFKFNTAISQMMICLNEFEEKGCDKKELENFMTILAPFAPTLCKDYLKSDWPTYDENKLVANVVNIALQINGKLRATFESELNADDETVKELAKNTEAYKKYILEEKVEIKKVIVVKNKIVNIVV